MQVLKVEGKITKIDIIPINKKPWSLNLIKEFYKGHPLEEVVLLGSKQLSPLKGMNMKSYKVEIFFSDGQSGSFGPIEESIAKGINELCKAVPFINTNNLYKLIDNLGRKRKNFNENLVKGVIDWAIQDYIKKNKVTSYIKEVKHFRCYANMITLDLRGANTLVIARKLEDMGFNFQKWDLPNIDLRDKKNLLHVIDLLETMKVNLSSGTQIMIELHGRLDEASCNSFLKASKALNLKWIEDPLGDKKDQYSYQKIANKDVSICIGEKFQNVDSFLPYIKSNKNYTINIDVVVCGGYTNSRQILNMCIHKQKKVAFHGRYLIPSIHLCDEIDDSSADIILEYNPIFEPDRQREIGEKVIPEDGFILFDKSNWIGISNKII